MHVSDGRYLYTRLYLSRRIQLHEQIVEAGMVFQNLHSVLFKLE